MPPNDVFDNCLIFGDNLLALKALEQEFAGKVKCVFIDPPYNTGSAFTPSTASMVSSPPTSPPKPAFQTTIWRNSGKPCN
ncbi:hypothetical protein FXN59_11005 [Aggregatibacter actinomycetemcomitans]|nr:hypothetical protein FXN59_11005 [Aggregatibacter actinomycetemcomitans]